MRTAPGFCTLRAFTTWNTSTTPSVLHRSMVVAMAQNMPQRLTASLQGRHHHTHTISLICTCTCMHEHMQEYSPAHLTPQTHHTLIHIHTYTTLHTPTSTHTYTHTPTHSYPYPHMLTDSNSETSHLQCITMGWLPVLLCTLLTSSITSVTVFRLEQLPSGAQLVMWNWLTCCALPDCKGTQGTCQSQAAYPATL